jgi:hypothetical protein
MSTKPYRTTYFDVKRVENKELGRVKISDFDILRVCCRLVHSARGSNFELYYLGHFWTELDRVWNFRCRNTFCVGLRVKTRTSNNSGLWSRGARVDFSHLTTQRCTNRQLLTFVTRSFHYAFCYGLMHSHHGQTLYRVHAVDVWYRIQRNVCACRKSWHCAFPQASSNEPVSWRVRNSVNFQ